ncbi:MAG: hypothetical protein KA100_04400 [Rickettsiales bacterium]|nr:hypothetical protein [Rickettsiales bacterium]
MIKKPQNLSLTTTESLTNSSTATLQSTKDLNLEAATFENSGSIKAFAKSTINTTTLTNQIGAVIYSADDASEIKASGSLTNYGNILSEKNLLLSGNQIKNDGAISVSGDLNFTLLSAFSDAALENNGSLKSLAKIDINNNSSSFASAVNNFSEISSGTNLSIAATTLRNSNSLQSNSTLALTLKDLTNSRDIKSGDVLTIKASGDVVNEALLQSATKLTIEASSFNNALAESLVLANQDLSISAASVKNKNTKPISGIISSGLVSVDGELSIKADELNNESGLITGKTTKLAALNNPKLNFISTSGILFSSGSIDVDMGDEDYKNEGEVTAKNVNVTANNIFNYGSLVASEFITFNANGINGGGSIVNGYDATTPDSVNLNKNILLAAASYIDFTAKNNIENYATISSATKLNLTSTNGNINNYSNAKITGGDDAATITALNGGFYNLGASSLFTSNNNADFNVKNLSNFGEISVANNLSTNITQDLLNQSSTALIWGGNDLTLNVAGTLSNSGADIYAIKNLTIQKNASDDASQNKAKLVQNISGNIESYAGDILINAEELINQRSADNLSIVIDSSYVDVAQQFYEHGPNRSPLITTNVWPGGCGLDCTTAVRFDIPGLSYFANYGYNITDHFGQSNSYIEKNVVVKRKENTNNIDSKIFAKNITINSDKFTNHSSEIAATENININTSQFNNTSQAVTDTVKHTCRTNGHCDIFQLNLPVGEVGVVDKGSYTYKFLGTLPHDYSYQFESVSSYMKASIKAGGSMTITQNGSDVTSSKILNDTEIQKGVDVDDVNYESKTTSFNKVDTYTLAETGAITLDLSSITSAINSKNSSKSSTDAAISDEPLFAGAYKINLDPASSKPLIEARSQFTQVSKFFGSKYYFDQLGIDGEAVLADIDRQSRDPAQNSRLLGDAFAESQLILKQLRTLTNDSLLLSKNNTQSDEEIKALIDNSIAEITRLGLSATDVAIKGLTKDQANSLTKDIITFEATKVNGISVLAPKIYLSLETRNRLLGGASSSPALATNSTLFAGGDLIINSPTSSLLNSGTISSGKDLTINVASLTSASKTLAAIIVPTVAPTALSISGTSSNFAINTGAAIKSLGNLNIAAGDSISLKNTTLNSGAKISLSAAKDITLANDKNFSLSGSLAKPLTATIGISSIKDDAAAARSALSFNAASDIELNSSGSINIANNYSNTSGSIFMTAAGDINNTNYTIKASENVVMNATNINNIHADKHYTTTGTTTTNETSIEADKMVSLNATKDTDGNGGNINNIGATIKAGELVYLTAENDITNGALVNYTINGTSTSADGSAITEEQALASNAQSISSILVSKGNITSDGNVVLVAGNNVNNKGSNITSTGAAYLEATAGDINITTATIRNHSEQHWGNKKNGGDRVSDIVTNTQSEITAGSDLILTAGNDIELRAAKLRAATNSSTPDATLNISAANNLLITTATDSSYQTESIRKNKTFTFKNTDSGSINTTVLNSELSTGATPSSSAINLTAGGATYAEFKNGSLEKASTTNPDGSVNSSYDVKLAYLKNLDPATAITNPIDEIHNSWNDTTRGLNQTGTIVVALVAALATGGAGMVGAMAGAAASTASVSAVNASMNADGNLLGSLDDVGKTTLKDTTSKESLKSIAVAGITAGIIQGVGELAKAKAVANAAATANAANNVASTANAANTANNVATAANAANTANNVASTVNNISNAQRILTNLTAATAKVGLNVAAYTIANSAVNGVSLTESLKQQDEKLLVAQILGETAAKEIGLLAHTDKISQAEQLTLHAALGCALSAGAGGNCAAGAAAGITSEYLAGKALNNGASAENAILIGQATGAAASLLTSAIQNRDDAQVAKDVQLGSFVGANAVMNNLLMPKEKSQLVKELDSCNGDSNCKQVVQEKYEKISQPRDEKFDQAMTDCKNGNCSDLKEVHYDLRGKLTQEGNEYFWDHAGEFELLPSYKSVYHTFIQDPTTGEILSGQNNNIKYVHPVMGYEVVIDQNNKIVTDSLNAGTYNFYNPSSDNALLGGFFSHKNYDVDPYVMIGNSPNDPSAKNDRGWLRNWESLKPIN